MPTRERFSWVWLSTLIIVYAAYFSTIALLPPPALSSPLPTLRLLALAGLVQMAAAGGFWLLMRSRAAGRTPPERDERDRAIEHRSSAVAYYVLIAGMIVVGCVMPFSASGWDVVHAAVFAIVLAEVVHHALVIRGYRRGWSA